MDYLNRLDKPTEVGIIRFWKDSIEDARPQAIDIREKLPSLVTAGNFLLWISRQMAKRSG